MSNVKKLTFAEKSRLDYQAIRRSSRKLVIDPVQLHPDNLLLPDEIDDEPNQLPAMFQGVPIKVRVPRPPEADEPLPTRIDIYLTWDGSQASTLFRDLTPLDSSLTFIEFELPGTFTEAQGRHELSYYLNQGGNTPDVTPLIINIDRTPPFLTTTVIVPPEVEANGITKKYLDDNGGEILVTMPPYGGARIGDHITMYYGEALPTSTQFGNLVRTDTTTPISFPLTAAVIGTDEGIHSIWYYVVDRKGNPAGPSDFKRLNVVLTDPPDGLVDLDIPLYSDGLIDLADAQMPVGVGLVAEYNNFVDGDEIVVTWDGQLLTPRRIPGFPFYVDVQLREVLNGDPGPKTVAVSYQIKRGSVYHPQIPLTQDVDVDLSKPGGPIDPDNPGPPNPNLALVTVQGTGGNPPNELTDADAGSNVDVSVVVYDGAKDADKVQLRWKGVLVSDTDGGVHTVVGTPVPPTRITFDIDWSVVDAGGNGNPIEVDYIISHDANDNVDISPPQDVDVFIRPGTVPDVAFLHLDDEFLPLLWMNCGSRRMDSVKGIVIEVAVAGGEPQLANQLFKFAYQGYTDAVGTIKPGTFSETEYTPTAQEAQDGFIVKIPWAPVSVTLNGYGDIRYVAKIDGRDVTSNIPLARVYMVDVGGGGGSCPIDPAP